MKACDKIFLFKVCKKIRKKKSDWDDVRVHKTDENHYYGVYYR